MFPTDTLLFQIHTTHPQSNPVDHKTNTFLSDLGGLLLLLFDTALLLFSRDLENG